MAKQLTPDEQKLMAILQRQGHHKPLVEMLQRIQADVDKTLRYANDVALYRSQGQAILLDELIEALNRR